MAMGRKNNSGLFQISHDTSHVVDEIVDQGRKSIGKDLVDPNIVSEMRNKKLKFSEKDLVFTAKDTKKNLIWLEKGNENAGLAHIVHQNHDRDFVQMHHVAGGDLVSHLYRIVTEGTIINEKPRYMGGIQVGVSRRYCYHGKYYSVFGVVDDGFIVTAHPERK
jgi:hypothetical protein